ncbi:MAG TPA: hypothetical protein VFN70_05400 [Burkholderiales bacterium]|nr:hypothetical protein [Burkholderiales bacterium]
MRARQCGYGILLALVILVLGSLYGLTRGLSQATAQTKHDDHDQAVLRQARDALVARAALDLNRPGSLPCPDSNDDGVADLLAGNVCPTYIGRLPWQTLRLPDLRDSTGERLWYVLSQPFTDSSASVINSDTQGTVVMTGLAPAANVIALVFAPGTALGGQDRSAVGKNIAANYLEDENRDAANNTYVARTVCVASDCVGGAFNDKVLAIGARDLFPVVENMVARRLRLQTDLGGAMFKEGASFGDKGHYQRWRDHAGVAGQGYFPFAAPFVQPDTSNFRGVLATHNGLMPVTREPTFVRWERANGNPAYNPNLVEETPGSDVYNAATACNTSTDDQIVCEVRYADFQTPRIRITGHALNVATSFVDPVQLGDVIVERWSGFSSSWVSGGGSVLSVSDTHVGAGLAGSARVEVVVNLASRSNSGTSPTRITFQKPPYNAAVVGPNWFVDNNWHQVTLYSVAPAATTVAAKDGSTGNPVCAVSADCLDAVNTANGGTGRHLLLMVSGLAVDNNTPRPAASLARYLEGRNVWTSGAHTPANQFEAFRAGKDRTNVVVGNDKLAVVAP